MPCPPWGYDAMRHAAWRDPNGPPVCVVSGQRQPNVTQGCKLRNTDWCFGVVCYAGLQTKMMKNLKKRPQKVPRATGLLDFGNSGDVKIFLCVDDFGFLWFSSPIPSPPHMANSADNSAMQF